MVNILFKWINVMLFAQIPKYHDFFGMDSENVETFLELGCNGIFINK